MMEDNKEPLMEHNSSVKQISIRSRQSRVMSQLSNVSQGDPYIYDLPDLGNVTQGVMCRLTAVSVVCVIFLSAEIVGGLMAQSLAILSDAAHMFSDMSGFFISIFSIWLGQRPASEKMSFGYHRAEVIGALASIILIWGLTILLFYEATIRIIGQVVVTDPLIMLITAGFGLFCNLVMAKVLHSSPTGGHDHGNIMHQCSGHDHGHGHGHDHKHSHGSNQKKKQKQKQKKSPKKKVYIQQKRSVISENGVSMLVVEQKLETSSSSNTSSNKFQPIKEESSENKSQTSQQDHNHSQMCIHQKKPITLEHNHSENCDHDHKEIDIPQDPNETIEQKKYFSNNNGNQVEPFETKQFQQQQQDQCKGDHNHDDHNHSHNHDDHNHSHDEHNHSHDDHDHNHEDQDHSHDHTHNHDDHDHHHDKRQKYNKSSNLSQIGEQDNYNLKAAMIHVIGDILQSIGVLIAALLIYFFGDKKDKDGVMIFTYWQYADPVCTYLFSILVLFTTFGVAKECLRVLMEGTPTGLIMEEFAEQMRAIHRVREVHDLHIWSLSVGKPAMSAHIVCIENPEYVLKKATKLCREFGIYHSTIQIELLDRQGAQDYIKCEHNLHR